MPTRDVVLPEQQAAMVERLVRQREAEDKARLAALRQAGSVGREDFEAGRFRGFADGEALRKHLAARAAKVLGRSSE